MIIPPNGAMPIPVATVLSVPSIAPVAAPAPTRDAKGGMQQEDRSRQHAPLYDRRGVVADAGKGRIVSRKA